MFTLGKIKGDHLFADVDDKNREQVIENIIEASTPRKSFFAVVAVSSIVCTAGLIMNSVALIIGAMLIAPILSAILSISLGIVVRNFKLFYRSVLVFLKAIILLFISAFAISMFFNVSDGILFEFLLKKGFELEIFIVSLVVGFIASLSFIRKELSQYISGTAIAVTLIPPVCISGIALKMGYRDYFFDALLIFGINFFGIMISSIAVFLATKFYKSKSRVVQELHEEERLLEKLSRKQKFKKWIFEGIQLIKRFFKRH
jgi:uncharacterized hydrophobic protein (TIGR00341 family)